MSAAWSFSEQSAPIPVMIRAPSVIVGPRQSLPPRSVREVGVWAIDSISLRRLVRLCLVAPAREKACGGHVRLVGVLGTADRRLLRATLTTPELVEFDIGRILLELRGEIGVRHGLEGLPGLFVDRHVHAPVGDAHLVGNVVPGYLLFDLLLAERRSEGAAHRR